MSCHRPISEISCGHVVCYQCFVLNTTQFGCIQCKKCSEVTNSQSNTETMDQQTVSEESNNKILTDEEKILNAFHKTFGLKEVRTCNS